MILVNNTFLKDVSVFFFILRNLMPQMLILDPHLTENNIFF